MSYLPDVWSDDDRMPGYMSMFKNRDVNPHDYDSKMKFWTNLTEKSCQELKDPCFTLKELTHNRFRRNDRIPAGMETVIREMIRSGSVVWLSDLAKGNEGWLSWGMDALVKRPIGWLLGYGSQPDINTDTLVLVDLVKSQAQELLSKHEQASASSPLGRDLIELCALRKCVSDIFASDRALDLALLQLQRDGHVSVGGGDNDKIVKFREHREQGPAKLTEIDTNYHKMKRALQKLDDEMLALEEEADSCKTRARQFLRQGNKLKAQQMLKQKLKIQKQIEQKDKVYDNMMSLQHKISDTKDQRQVLDAYKAGVSAFKENLKSHGLSPGQIDNTMDDIQEALSDHDDISLALSQGATSFDTDGDLEDELHALLDEDKPKVKEPRLELPSVPTEQPKTPDRIKNLRQQLLEA